MFVWVDDVNKLHDNEDYQTLLDQLTYVQSISTQQVQRIRDLEHQLKEKL